MIRISQCHCAVPCCRCRCRKRIKHGRIGWIVHGKARELNNRDVTVSSFSTAMTTTTSMSSLSRGVLSPKSHLNFPRFPKNSFIFEIDKNKNNLLRGETTVETHGTVCAALLWVTAFFQSHLTLLWSFFVIDSFLHLHLCF